MSEHVALYDTTPRDGAQQEGTSLLVIDKLAALSILSDLGADFVEGGWPRATPRDTAFFERARFIRMCRARLVAFGTTTRPGVAAAEGRQVRALLDSSAQIIIPVTKSDVRHAKRVSRISEDEGLRMVCGTVAFLSEEGIDVMVDLEHFFDGLAYDSDYGMPVMMEAALAGAAAAILCDTNGGNLPPQVSQAMRRARAVLDDVGCMGVILGIYAHNDTGCVVANAVAVVEAGACQIQGTVNGYGERTGNVNLLTCAANLQLRCGFDVIPEESLAKLESVSRRVLELINIVLFPREPYVGDSAFAHKAGLHASAIRVDPDPYQHIDLTTAGNGMKMPVSEMAGKSSIELKAEELDINLESPPNAAARIAMKVKEREAVGYTYDMADTSSELPALNELGCFPRFLRVEPWKVMSQEIAEAKGEPSAQPEATVKIHTNRRHIRTAEGNGPVNAPDRALRHAMTCDYPVCVGFELASFKVRILDEERAGIDATIRVLIGTSDDHRPWWTVGIGTDVIEASWGTLFEAYWWGLLRSGAGSLLTEQEQTPCSLNRMARPLSRAARIRPYRRGVRLARLSAGGQ